MRHFVRTAHPVGQRHLKTRDIVAKIREQEADYVLSVKENQPGLYREIKEYFE
jgi:predicted transposase YbfD/YdcC